MTTTKPVILLEFNELSPSLMAKFMSSGKLPNFQRLHGESQVYVTDAEEEGEALNPWVQWVTVHSGLSAAEHGVQTLSESHKLQHKAVWDLLSDAGLRVLVCGSMNVRYDQPLNGYVLPDPWSTGVPPYPPGEFEAYYDFIRTAVQEHTNAQAGSSKLRAVRFLAFMLTHGLSFNTATSAIRQILSERRHDVRWKRAAIMDQLQLDIFRRYYRKQRPHFSTFFLNSTAHFQHSYWRHMDPEAFSVRPSDQEREQYGGAILYGYRKMDELVGRFLKLAGADATLVFCTGLSQQPYLKCEATGGRQYYRVKSPKVLTEQLGLPGPFKYEPVMAEQFHLRFETEDTAADAQRLLESYRLPDERVFEAGRNRVFHLTRQDAVILCQCRCTRAVPGDAVIGSEAASRAVSFYEVFYRTDVVKSGQHHPDGMLWVRQPNREHAIHQGKVSLRSIAPAILQMFGVSPPEFMSGRSFFEESRPTFQDPRPELATATSRSL